MRVLLTGATGLLGNNLLRMLLDDRHQVTVTVRSNSDPRPLADLSVEKVACDLCHARQAADAVRGAELVIHSAADIHIGWRGLARARQVNVEATRQLAQSARLQGSRMIHVSTVDTLAAAVEGQLVCENEAEPPKPLSVYVASKREAEVVFREQVARGLDGLIVNPGFMIGPWDWRPSSGRMLITVARSFTPFAPSGGCSVVDVRDVACGILSACFHGRCGENYILAGENVTYFDLWRRMAEISGGRPPWYLIPPRINWLAGKIGDLKTAITGKESIVNSAATQMGALKHWYCSQKAIDQLGYRIGPVDDALADAWDWFRAYGYV